MMMIVAAAVVVRCDGAFAMMEVLFVTMTPREGGQPPPMETLTVVILYYRSDYEQRRIDYCCYSIQIMILNQPVLIYWAMQQPMLSLLVTPPPR